MTRYVGAIDQGTTSSRFIVFDRAGDTVAMAQRDHRPESLSQAGSNMIPRRFCSTSVR